MNRFFPIALAAMLAGAAHADYTCSSDDNTIGEGGNYSDEFIRTGNAGGTNACIGVVEGSDFDYVLPVLLGREVYAQRDVTLTFEAWFKEAGWTNEFGWQDEVILSNNRLGESFSRSVTVGEGDGLLPFFYVADVASQDRGPIRVSNGDNEDMYLKTDGSPTFAFAYYEGYYYLGLNDDGEPGQGRWDFDVDDFVVRFSVAVPEPANSALLVLGVVGLALTRLARRSRRV